MRPHVLVEGDPRHGVVRYAAALAGAVGGEQDAARVHAQFTDRLWGATPEDAAEAFERFAAQRPTTVTLHDVPQPSDGARNLPRRAAAYARVLAAARQAVVHSRYEAGLLRAHVASEAALCVIPHFVRAPLHDGPRPAGDGSIAVLGWIYPGKGHAEVLDAAAQLGGVPVVALGAAAPGHDADVLALRTRAEQLGVPFTVTGFLDDAELHERLRRAAVPVAAHQHVSASGSMTSWMSAGRRPVVPDTAYTRELLALRPGTLKPYPPTRLAPTLRDAAARPSTTWLDPAVRLPATLPDVARAYLAWWSEVDW